MTDQKVAIVTGASSSIGRATAVSLAKERVKVTVAFQNVKNKKLGDLLEEIRSKVDVSPSPYSAVAYDIFWVAAMAENVTRYNEGDDTSNQGVQELKEAITSSANSYLGVTGNTTLNTMGDRAEGEYDYWKVTAKADEGKAHTFSWNKMTN